MDEIERLEELHASIHAFVERISAYRRALLAEDFHPVIAEQMTAQYHAVMMSEYNRALEAEREATKQQNLLKLVTEHLAKQHEEVQA